MLAAEASPAGGHHGYTAHLHSSSRKCSTPRSQVDNTKAHQCHMCPYKSVHRGNLITHLRIHMKEKPYKCSECLLSFRQKQHLKDHMHIHTGARPFTCNFCPGTFNRKYILQKHIRRQHSQCAPRIAAPPTFKTSV